MSGAVTVRTHPGKALPDRDMQVWDGRERALKDRDWTAEDRGFERIQPQLGQVAAGRGDTGEHIIPEHTPISDQGARGTCAANCWMDALEILMGLEGPGKVVQLSRLFAYWTARELTGLETEDRGVYLRAVAHQLRKIGVVEEQYMPYRDSLEAVLARPKLSLYTMASNNRIGSFYRITSRGQRRLDDIEVALRADHPVVSAAPVAQEFIDYRGGGHVFGAPQRSEGPHAMLMVGVRTVAGRRQFLRRNSWGRYWGDDGRAWCDEDYVLLDDDIWVGTRMPDLV